MPSAADPGRSDIGLLYRRAGFGTSGAELDRLAAAGYESAVDELVAGLTSADPAGDGVALPTFAPYQRPIPSADAQ